jgi:thiamine biosynthesis lipoprotein
MGTTMLTPPESRAGALGHDWSHDIQVAAMGGVVHLVVTGDPDGRRHAPTAADLARRGAERLADLESRWSRFRPDSEISRLNASQGAALLVSPATYALVERVVAAWQVTGGRCDATVLPALLQLGYDRSFEHLAAPPPPGWAVPDGPRPPAGPAPGCHAVHLVPEIGAVRLTPGTALDPGAIGRGFAADLVAAEILAAGAAGVLVDVDGDVRMSGRGPVDGSWIVSVADPHVPGAVLARLAIGDGAVATSTGDRRSWGQGGRAVHHVVDPRTGRPVEDALASVTVLAGDAWMAEALSTGALVAGARDAASFLAERHATALLVATDGTVEHVGPVGAYLA